VADRVLSQLLTEMDGVGDRKRVIVVAATNRPDLLDKALVRPGRLDRMIYVPPPPPLARLEILRIHARNVPLHSDVDLAALAGQPTDGFSGAEVAALCREAAMLALQEAVEAGRPASTVEHRHFEHAVRATLKQITPDMLAFYEAFRRNAT
jgi:SpoVK/Ycf46/Vps4 family AAA+-type ATPase